MAQFPYKPQKQIRPDCSYQVMVSKLPLKHYGSIPKFMKDTLVIRKQLQTTPGLIGYGLLAELSKKTFFTFSIWENMDDLNTFANTNPHQKIIENLRPKMGHAVFKFNEVEGSKLPWNWDQAKAQLTDTSDNNN